MEWKLRRKMGREYKQERELEMKWKMIVVGDKTERKKMKMEMKTAEVDRKNFFPIPFLYAPVLALARSKYPPSRFVSKNSDICDVINSTKQPLPGFFTYFFFFILLQKHLL